MTKTKRLQRRGDTFFCRVAVPHALRPVLGKNEIVRTLGTSDIKTAKNIWRVETLFGVLAQNPLMGVIHGG